MGSEGDAIGDRGTAQRIDRLALKPVAPQVSVLRIPRQRPLPFQVAADAPGKGLGQLRELGAGRCLHPTEAQRAIRTLDIDPVEEQHVEVQVQIQRAAETLDQGDRAGLRRLPREARLLDQVRSDAPVDDAEHPAHDLGAAREQEAQRIRDTQHPLTHRLRGKHLVDQQCGVFGHAPGTAARAD